MKAGIKKGFKSGFKTGSVETCQSEIGISALTAEDLKSMAAAAWHRHGVIVIRPEDITNSFNRQAVINAANDQYGKRPK